MPEPPRIAAIDVLRGVAILGVAGLHVSWRWIQELPLLDVRTRPLIVLNLFFTFGAPLFLALSAAALSLRYRERFASLADFIGFLRRRAVQLLPAYVLWSITSAASHDVTLVLDPLRVASLLRYGTGDAQLYFVPLLFQLYLVWPLLQPMVAAVSRIRHAILLLAGGAAISWAAAYQYIGTPLLLVLFLVYVCTGVAAAPLLAGGKMRSAAPAGAAAVATVLSFAVFVDDFFDTLIAYPTKDAAILASMIFQTVPMIYIVAFTLLGALAAPALASSWAGRALAALGRASYGIFLSHLLVARFLVFPLLLGDADAGTPVVPMIVAWLATVVLSHAFTLALASGRWTSWIVGARA